jgi:hypothetical protein
VKCHAVFSPDRKYRFRLTRIWNESCPLLMWIMLNPSTADESRDDPTIRRCIGFSINNGFGGLLVHNLFSFRSSDPHFLYGQKDPVGPDYDDMIIEDACSGMRIICAWGTVPKMLLWRERDVLSFLKGLDLNFLQMTKSQHPAHPLYLSSKCTLKPLIVG